MTQSRPATAGEPLGAEELLAQRYGPARRTSPVLIFAVFVSAILFVGWVVWAGFHQADQDVRWRTVGYSNSTDSSITVEFDVFKPAGSTVTCLVRALDLQSSEVGRAEVPVTSTQPDANVVYRLAVTERPNTAEVASCRLDQNSSDSLSGQ